MVHPTVHPWKTTERVRNDPQLGQVVGVVESAGIAELLPPVAEQVEDLSVAHAEETGDKET